jgi:hypothetical protein
MMVTIVWNPTGFDRIVALPKGMKFNADYYISHIPDPLADWQRRQVEGRIEDRMSRRTMLTLTLQRRLLNFSQAMACKELYSCYDHGAWHRATFTFLGTSKTGSQVYHLSSPINFCRRLI